MVLPPPVDLQVPRRIPLPPQAELLGDAEARGVLRDDVRLHAVQPQPVRRREDVNTTITSVSRDVGVVSHGTQDTGYELLHLVTYFTAGPKEARAWTITKGTKGPAAAGVIHSDFERGFIRAETIAYDDFVKYSGESGARDAGKLRLEGKEYVVADGDVMHFRFNT